MSDKDSNQLTQQQHSKVVQFCRSNRPRYFDPIIAPLVKPEMDAEIHLRYIEKIIRPI